MPEGGRLGDVRVLPVGEPGLMGRRRPKVVEFSRCSGCCGFGSSSDMREMSRERRLGAMFSSNNDMREMSRGSCLVEFERSSRGSFEKCCGSLRFGVMSSEKLSWLSRSSLSDSKVRAVMVGDRKESRFGCALETGDNGGELAMDEARMEGDRGRIGGESRLLILSSLKGSFF